MKISYFLKNKCKVCFRLKKLVNYVNGIIYCIRKSEKVKELMKKLFLKLLAPITVAATALPMISCGGFLFPQTAKYYHKELNKIIDSKCEYKVYEYSKELVDFVSRGQTLITTKEFVIKGINDIDKIPLFYENNIGYAITLNLSSFLKHLNSLGKINFYRYVTNFH